MVAGSLQPVSRPLRLWQSLFNKTSIYPLYESSSVLMPTNQVSVKKKEITVFLHHSFLQLCFFMPKVGLQSMSTEKVFVKCFSTLNCTLIKDECECDWNRGKRQHSVSLSSDYSGVLFRDIQHWFEELFGWMWEWMALKDGNFLEDNRSIGRFWPWARACVSPWAEDKYAALLRRCSAGGWFPLRHFSQAISLSCSHYNVVYFQLALGWDLNVSRHDCSECQASHGYDCIKALC